MNDKLQEQIRLLSPLITQSVHYAFKRTKYLPTSRRPFEEGHPQRASCKPRRVACNKERFRVSDGSI